MSLHKVRWSKGLLRRINPQPWNSKSRRGKSINHCDNILIGVMQIAHCNSAPGVGGRGRRGERRSHFTHKPDVKMIEPHPSHTATHLSSI